jgi:hypothetical protein
MMAGLPGSARELPPHIRLILRAYEFCSKPEAATKDALVAAVRDCAGVEIPELYNPLFASCEAARNSRPLEWPGIAGKIDGEIHDLGATLRAGGWFKRKDIAA